MESHQARCRYDGAGISPVGEKKYKQAFSFRNPARRCRTTAYSTGVELGTVYIRYTRDAIANQKSPASAPVPPRLFYTAVILMAIVSNAAPNRQWAQRAPGTQHEYMEIYDGQAALSTRDILKCMNRSFLNAPGGKHVRKLKRATAHSKTMRVSTQTTDGCAHSYHTLGTKALPAVVEHMVMGAVHSLYEEWIQNGPIGDGNEPVYHPAEWSGTGNSRDSGYIRTTTLNFVSGRVQP